MTLLFLLLLPAVAGFAAAASACLWAVPLALLRSRALFQRYASAWQQRRAREHGSAYRSGKRLTAADQPLGVRAVEVASLAASYASPCVIAAALGWSAGIFVALVAAPIVIAGSVSLARFAKELAARRPLRGRVDVAAVCLALAAGGGLMGVARITPDVIWTFAVTVSLSTGCALIVVACAIVVALWPAASRMARTDEEQETAKPKRSVSGLIARTVAALCAAFGGMLFAL